MSATTVEYIGGIEVIKAFNQADNSYQKFTDAVHANADLIFRLDERYTKIFGDYDECMARGVD